MKWSLRSFGLARRPMTAGELWWHIHRCGIDMYAWGGPLTPPCFSLGAGCPAAVVALRRLAPDISRHFDMLHLLTIGAGGVPRNNR